MSAVHETTSARPRLTLRRRAFPAPLLALALSACASSKSESSGPAAAPGAVPGFIKTDGP